MLKKVLFLTIFAITSLQGTTLDILQEQRNHIRTQMNAIKRSWNTARLHIKMAKNTSPSLYATIHPILEKQLSNANITTKMETDITAQVNAIVNENASFASVKKDYTLSDFLSDVSMQDYGKKLFSAMANKAAYLLLGQKLAPKIAEIDLAISLAQQPAGV